MTNTLNETDMANVALAFDEGSDADTFPMWWVDGLALGMKAGLGVPSTGLAFALVIAAMAAAHELPLMPGDEGNRHYPLTPTLSRSLASLLAQLYPAPFVASMACAPEEIDVAWFYPLGRQLAICLAERHPNGYSPMGGDANSTAWAPRPVDPGPEALSNTQHAYANLALRWAIANMARRIPLARTRSVTPAERAAYFSEGAVLFAGQADEVWEAVTSGVDAPDPAVRHVVNELRTADLYAADPGRFSPAPRLVRCPTPHVLDPGVIRTGYGQPGHETYPEAEVESDPADIEEFERQARERFGPAPQGDTPATLSPNSGPEIHPPAARPVRTMNNGFLVYARRAKETPNAVRFRPEDRVIDAIYLRLSTDRLLGHPERIAVRIEGVAEEGEPDGN